jgi:N6-L-threonylcarbamoyladenine synthase
MSDGTLDFSFSGLKTAVRRYVEVNELEPATDPDHPPQPILDLVASFQRTVVRTLLHRLAEAMAQFHPQTIILAGGVACNSQLRREAKALAGEAGIPLYYPSPLLTTDNAAMIAAAAYPKLQRGERSDFALTAVASLKLYNLNARLNSAQSKARYKL